MSKRILLTQYIGFITIGLAANIIGPVLPTISNEFNMNYSQAGYILSGQFLGALLTVQAAGHIADKIGKKPFLLIGSLILFAGILGSILAQSYLSLLFWTVVSGIGFGMYDAGINALCADVADSDKGNAMNLLHFFYGLGAFSGPLLTTLIFGTLGSWRLVYAAIAFLPFVVAALLYGIQLPRPTSPPAGPAQSGSLYRHAIMWLYGLFIFIYCGIEVAAYGWLPAYWEDLFHGQAFIPSSFMPSFFWLTLTIGRLLSGKIADKLGFSRYIAVACWGVAIVALSWAVIPLPHWTMAAALLLGFLLAGLYPTVMVSAIGRAPRFSGQIAGFISVFGSLGGFFIPSGIGVLADSAGIMQVPRLIFLLSVIMLGLAITLQLRKTLSAVKL